MRILLIGHGKMGRMVESLAAEYGCEVAGIVDPQSPRHLGAIPTRMGDAPAYAGGVDVAIDFTSPDAVLGNVSAIARLGLNVVLGTTGWQPHEAALRGVVAAAGTGIVAAPNFSVGVVLFDAVVARAAALFASQQDVGAWLHEEHHAAKKDAPSGTALQLKRTMEQAGYSRPIDVSSTRAGYIPGVHTIGFDGPAESITLSHTARDRSAFARGALQAAQWVKGKHGWFTMKDVLESNHESAIHRGVGTALVTPFTKAGDLDDAAVRRLGRRQMDGGIHFLCPCGTTGENPTLTEAERIRVVEILVDEAKEKTPILAGAGGYNTKEVIHLAGEMRRVGAAGLLSVTPYYNRPTQEGLYQHYRAIAESTPLPIIVYNVPSRTGTNVEPATLVRLAAIPNIVGVKKASGNISQMCEICRVVPSNFIVLSGDDAVTLPLMAVGGRGVISVVSNEIPAEMVQMVEAAERGDFAGARAIHNRIYALMQVNFIEANPVPVKTAMAAMGLLEEAYRLPMCAPKPESRDRILKVLKDLGCLKQTSPVS